MCPFESLGFPWLQCKLAIFVKETLLVRKLETTLCTWAQFNCQRSGFCGPKVLCILYSDESSDNSIGKPKNSFICVLLTLLAFDGYRVNWLFLSTLLARKLETTLCKWAQFNCRRSGFRGPRVTYIFVVW